MRVKAVILRASGINCDVETERAFQAAGADAERVHIRRFLDGERRLDEFHILAIPGGFSYGDDIAAGKALANELVHRMHAPLRRFVEAGKPVLGVCNGFQVLVRAGLLPGGELGTQTASLAWNDSGKFECRWTRLKPAPSRSIFTKGIDTEIELPVAHAEGKFLTGGDDLLDALEANGQVALRYAGEGYPAIPNGSARAIAAVCDPSGVVMGMMPHPERFISRYQHPRWTREPMPEEGTGLAIFRNAVEYAQALI